MFFTFWGPNNTSPIQVTELFVLRKMRHLYIPPPLPLIYPVCLSCRILIPFRNACRILLFSLSFVEGVFLFPDGSSPGLQQSIHESIWPTSPFCYVRKYEPSWNGSQHGTFQHEWPSNGDESASAWHEPFWSSRTKDAPAKLSWTQASVTAHARHEKALPRGGERAKLCMI